MGRAGASSVLLAGIGALACVANPGHRCDEDAQCMLATEGRCEAVGACSYPDLDCPSGRRYGEWAPPDIANTCVPPVGEGSSSSTGEDTTTMGSPASESTQGPEPNEPPDRTRLCGNGERDPGEGCDGPRPGCNPTHCVEPGTVLWEQVYDGPAEGSDRGVALVLDPAGDSFYLAGLVYTGESTGQDALVQRRSVSTGELQWEWTRPRSPLEDLAEDITIVGDHTLLVVGTVTTAATGEDVWMAAFDLDPLDPSATPKLAWQILHDHAGDDDHARGVTATENGTIVIVGWTEPAADDDVLFVRVSEDGESIESTALDLSAGAGDDRLHDVIADANDLLVTGFFTHAAADAATVYTARYTLDLAEITGADEDPPDSGHAHRGIGLARMPNGGLGVAGSHTGDRHVWLYADAEALEAPLTKPFEGDLHDEATCIAFHPDGSYVVSGLLDFVQGGTSSDPSDDDSEWWVGVMEANHDLRWDTRSRGIEDAVGVDRALGVVIADETAIVTGYTITGDDNVGRGVRIVRYAL